MGSLIYGLDTFSDSHNNKVKQKFRVMSWFKALDVACEGVSDTSGQRCRICCTVNMT